MNHQDHIQSWNICIIMYNCSHIRLPYQEKFPLMADSYILMAYEMAMNLCQNFMRCTTSGPSRWPPSSQFRRSANHFRVVCCARCAGNGFWKIFFRMWKPKKWCCWFLPLFLWRLLLLQWLYCCFSHHRDHEDPLFRSGIMWLWGSSCFKLHMLMIPKIVHVKTRCC